MVRTMGGVVVRRARKGATFRNCADCGHLFRRKDCELTKLVSEAQALLFEVREGAGMRLLLSVLCTL